MKRLAVVLAILLVAAPVLGHGAREWRTETSGDYEIEHGSYTLIEQEETIRLKWRVTNTSSGDRVDLTGDTVTFKFYKDGSVDRTEDFTIEEQANGDHFVDLSTGVTTKIEHTLELPEGESITFSDPVEDTSQNGGNGNGDNGNTLPFGLPGPNLVAGLAALAAAALIVQRRR